MPYHFEQHLIAEVIIDTRYTKMFPLAGGSQEEAVC